MLTSQVQGASLPTIPATTGARADEVLAALLALGLLLGASAPALAAATPEEAQRLTALFQSYLGADPGVVTVTPAGASYAARFDLAPLIAKLAGAGPLGERNAHRMDHHAARCWQMAGRPGPAALHGRRSRGQFDIKAQVGAITGTGIFDEALGTFASTSTEYRQIAIEQTVTEQNQTARSSYTIASVKVQSANTGTGGNVDGAADPELCGLPSDDEPSRRAGWLLPGHGLHAELARGQAGR